MSNPENKPEPQGGELAENQLEQISAGAGLGGAKATPKNPGTNYAEYEEISFVKGASPTIKP